MFDLRDYKIHGFLGNGTYTNVYEIRHKEKNDLQYALRIINKEHIVKKRNINNINREYKIIKTLMEKDVDNIYIVKPHHILQDDINLYYVMDNINYGDLFDLLNNNCKSVIPMQKGLSSSIVIHITAQIVKIYEFLRENNIIYRDFKAENFLINKWGFIRLIDFNLSAIVEDKSVKLKECMGTLDYLPPEMINGDKYDYGIDLWSIGVIIYELITGKNPYVNVPNFNDIESKTQREEILQGIYKNICDNPIKKTWKMTHTLFDFISNLLKLNPEERLGYNDITELRNHAIFKDYNWEIIENQNNNNNKKASYEIIRKSHAIFRKKYAKKTKYKLDIKTKPECTRTYIDKALSKCFEEFTQIHPHSKHPLEENIEMSINQ